MFKLIFKKTNEELVFDSLKGIEDLIRFGFTTKSMGRDVPFLEKM